MPIALALLGLGVAKGVYDLIAHPVHIAGNTVLIFVSGLIIATFALLADLIVRSRSDPDPTMRYSPARSTTARTRPTSASDRRPGPGPARRWPRWRASSEPIGASCVREPRDGRAATAGCSAWAGFWPPRSGHARYMSQAAGGTGIVIVGGGIAGGNAAVTLRQEGYRGPVMLDQPGTGRPLWPASALQDVPAVGGRS